MDSKPKICCICFDHIIESETAELVTCTHKFCFLCIVSHYSRGHHRCPQCLTGFDSIRSRRTYGYGLNPNFTVQILLPLLKDLYIIKEMMRKWPLASTVHNQNFEQQPFEHQQEEAMEYPEEEEEEEEPDISDYEDYEISIRWRRRGKKSGKGRRFGRL